MVTPETLTDDMIRELRREIAGRVFPAAGMAHTGLSDLWRDTEDALGIDPDSFSDAQAALLHRVAARRRVCAAINARSARENKDAIGPNSRNHVRLPCGNMPSKET